METSVYRRIFRFHYWRIICVADGYLIHIIIGGYLQLVADYLICHNIIDGFISANNAKLLCGCTCITITDGIFPPVTIGRFINDITDGFIPQ